MLKGNDVCKFCSWEDSEGCPSFDNEFCYLCAKKIKSDAEELIDFYERNFLKR